MSKFKVWQDGQESEAIEVVADGMPEALDKAAQQWGYIDHSDMAQELGWTDSKLNIVAAKVTVAGRQVDFDAAVNLMDDELREQVHAAGIQDEQKFVDAYCTAHAVRYGEEFQVA